MRCDEVHPRLEAFVDGELAESERAQLRDHLASCPECGPEATELERLRDGIRRSAPVYRAPEALRSQIRFALRQEAAATARAARPAPGWLAYAASILLAVALGSGGTLLITGERQQDAVANELIDSHLRSLLGSHLTDVASSDQHTVKPWFDGKLDFAPTVENPASDGFPLVGGRLDFLDNRPVAALVYQRRKHFINVFIWPVETSDTRDTKAMTHQGYQLLHWVNYDLHYWAVSDVSGSELMALWELIDKQTPPR